MSQPASWLPQVKRTLSSSDDIKDWLVGQFRDRPKSWRLGLLCLTDGQLIFFRKTLFGREMLTWPLSDIKNATIGAFGGLTGPKGEMAELKLELVSGATLGMSFISRGNPESFVQRLIRLRSE